MKLTELLTRNKPHDCAKKALTHPNGYICDRCGEEYSPLPQPAPGNPAPQSATYAGAPEQADRMVALLLESMLGHPSQR